MLNPTTVHQIWIGSNVPEREQKWIDTVKHWCSRSGIKHVLWTLPELSRTFPNDPVWDFVHEMPECVRKYVFLADYFRIMVLNRGEMYIDTDMSCRRKPSINFNGQSLLGMGEYWDANQCATAFIGIQNNFQMLETIKNKFRSRLKELDENCLDDLPAALGPEYYRGMLNEIGIKPIIMPRSEITHIQWKNIGSFVHEGAGAWV